MAHDFVDISKRIVAVLMTKSADLGLDEREVVQFVYNEAMKDAVEFVEHLAESNPQHRMLLANVAKEIKHWLPLR